MARTDIEESSEPNSAFRVRRMVRDTDDTLTNGGNTVHSGHFMVSCLTDDENDDDESLPSGIKIEEVATGYDFNKAPKETKRSYQFIDKNNAAVAAGIETDLTKLFQCMTLAYSGKLTSPKWKNFKGLKLTIKDKVRLNNIIWREWHSQFVLLRGPKICQFEPPISDKTHTKPEAIVLEGKYWKRKLNSVTSEYMKWRLFCKKYKSRPEDQHLMNQVASHAELLGRVGQQSMPVFRFGQTPNMSARSPTSSADLMDDTDFMDLSDTLFSTLEKNSFVFPTPREISQLGNADIIQPGLIGLQPAIDDYMDTLEPLPSLQEMMGGGRSPRASTMTSSMLVDPIADPFFTDTSTGLGVDFLANAPSPLTNLLLDNQLPPSQPPTIHQHSILQPANQQPADLSQAALQQNLVSQLQEGTSLGSPSQPPQQVNFESATQAQANTANSPDVLTQEILRKIGLEPASPPHSSPQNVSLVAQQNVTGQLVQQQNINVQIAHQQQQQQQHSAQPAQPHHAAEARNQNNQNAAAQLLSLILEHGLANGSTSSPTSLVQVTPQSSPLKTLSPVTSSIVTSQSPLAAPPLVTSSNLLNNTNLLNSTIATLRQQIHAIGQQQNNAAQLTNTNTGLDLTQSRSLPHVSHQLGPGAGVGLGAVLGGGLVKGGHQSDSALVLQQSLHQQQQQPTSQLHSLLQGINQPTSAIIKRKPEATFIDLTTNQTQPQPNTEPTKYPHSHQRHRSGGQEGRGQEVVRGRGRGRPRSDPNRRASTGSVAKPEFKVPDTPNRYKQVKIAPAPPIAQKPGRSPGVTVGSAAKSVTHTNTFLAQLLQGQDMSVPSIALKTEPVGNYALIQPKPIATTTANLATPQSKVTFSLATESAMLLSNQLNTDKMADIMTTTNTVPHPLGAMEPPFTDSTGQFRVPSPAGSTESGPRSRHASSESVGSPGLVSIKEEKDPIQSPGRPTYGRRKTDLDPVAYKEHRRASHISAEQKRRFNIKYGFDTLCHMVPSLSSNPNAKVSKAAILSKAADYARKLKVERSRMHDEADLLKQEVEALNSSISACQSQLPATGVPVSGQRVDRMRAVFDEYVRSRTLKNWKYWIFSVIVIGMQAGAESHSGMSSRVSLFDTYSNTVSTASIEEFCRTVLSWLDQHCSLVALRPAVLPSLTRLSTSTSILTDPARVPEEATKAVIDRPRDHGTEIN